MRPSKAFWLPGLLAGLLSLPAGAEEPTGLFKRAANVDKPIPETYEPLDSTYMGEGGRLDDTIEQSWKLREEAGEADASGPDLQPVNTGSSREELEKRIQEPGVRPAQPPEPAVTDTGKSLEIRGE
jgi:hypothetical protein